LGFSLTPAVLEAGNFINRGGLFVTLLLKLSQLIDWLNERVGKGAFWLVLVMTTHQRRQRRHIASFSTTVRTACWKSSGICLPPFSCSARRTRCKTTSTCASTCCPASCRHAAWPGHRHHRHLFFLLPMVGLVLWLSLPLVAESYKINEMSANAGGLIRWPVKMLLPIGFTLLALQGISELIKRIAFLKGPDRRPERKEKGPDARRRTGRRDRCAKAKEAK
jgi:TRAP-type mannitol/chloroaromatic compound transport system permease small subunit